MVNFNNSSAVKFTYIANPAVNRWNIEFTPSSTNSPIKDALKAINNNSAQLSNMKANGFIVQKGGIYSGKDSHYAIGNDGKAKIIPKTLKSKILNKLIGVRGQEKQDLREINRELKKLISSSKFYL